MEIDRKIANFKKDLSNTSISDIDIVRKYIVSGSAFIFSDDSYFNLKNIVSQNFNVHVEDVKMVGSAKLGFSIAPMKLWKYFDDESDIDVVIISETIFDEFWIDLHDFNIRIINRSEYEEERYYKFLGYFFRGWIRPDFFSFRYKKKSEWFE